MSHPGRELSARGGALLALALALVLSGGAVLAQRKQSKEPKGQKTESQVRLPDEQAVDLAISEMLAAWQMGDVEMLHKYYADDVTVVSGAWEPPLLGWANLVRAYQRQRERMQSGRLDRSNSFIKVKGNFAWANYQWEFNALVDDKPSAAHGQTTLVMEKRAERWVIVLNHTSIVPEMREPAPTPGPGAPKPTPPPSAPGPGDAAG